MCVGEGVSGVCAFVWVYALATAWYHIVCVYMCVCACVCVCAFVCVCVFMHQHQFCII